MLAETPVAQRNPCYSAVSASLMNPLPDCSNYSPFCHTHYLLEEKEGMVERLGEMRKGERERREDRDRKKRERDKRELR